MTDNITANGTQLTTLNTIIPVFTFVAGLVVKILWDLIYKNISEKGIRKKQALISHYQILDTREIVPLIDQLKAIELFRGQLIPFNQRINWPLIEKCGITSKLNLKNNNFSIHFPEQSKQIISSIKKLDTHNSDVIDFFNIIEGCIRLKYPIRDYFVIGDNESIFYENTPKQLMENLFLFIRDTLNNTKTANTLDFDHSCIRKEEDRWVLTNSQETIKYAALVSRDEAQNCKQILVDLQNSTELKKKAEILVKQSNSVKVEIDEDISSLEFLRENYSKLGTILERRGNCPYCKEINKVK